MDHDSPDAWIETTFFRGEARAGWIVRVGNEILKVGETRGVDPSGIAAYEAAMSWAAANVPAISFNWKHGYNAFEE